MLAGLGALVLSASLRERAYSVLLQDSASMAPFAIAPRLFYVGSSDIAVFALQTSEGLIVIDGGYDWTAQRVIENLRKLGFDPRSVRILLNSHAHFDHAAGLSRLKAETGARLYASPEDAALLEAGGRGDFCLGDWMTFPRVSVDHLLRDGEEVRLGDTTLTAHFTPGHTKGCTSWSFPVKVDGATVQALSICSLSTLRYRLVENPAYPGIVQDFTHSFDVLARLPCELFLGAHGKFFDLAGKRARQLAGGSANPFIDAAGCRTFIEGRRQVFREALARQGS